MKNYSAAKVSPFEFSVSKLYLFTDLNLHEVLDVEAYCHNGLRIGKYNKLVKSTKLVYLSRDRLLKE